MKQKKLYSAKLNDLSSQRSELIKQKKALEGKADKKDEYDGVTLELNDVNKKYDAAREFAETLFLLENFKYNQEISKQQSKTQEKVADDMAKCLETARRIAKGAKVPAKDIKKLMEYSMELYMQAMNAAMLNKKKEKKEYKSLWEDEEENTKQKNTDIEAQIQDMEISIDMPEL